MEKKHHRQRAWWKYNCGRVGVRWHRLNSKTGVIMKNARTHITRFFDKLKQEQLNKTVMFHPMHFIINYIMISTQNRIYF